MTFLIAFQHRSHNISNWLSVLKWTLQQRAVEVWEKCSLISLRKMLFEHFPQTDLWVFPKHYRELTLTVITTLIGHRKTSKLRLICESSLNIIADWPWQLSQSNVTYWPMINDFNEHNCRLLSKDDVFECLSKCSIVDLFKFVHTFLSLFKIRTWISEILHTHVFVLISCRNSCTNSYVTCVHEIHTKFIVFGGT